VRIHTGGEADQLNRQLSAQAFTHGQDIYMGAGKYAPGTSAGNRLLAHELTHVIQQGGTKGVQRALKVSDNPVNAEAPPLVDVSEPDKQGAVGKVYFLKNQTGEELVIKYTTEDPKSALIETEMLNTTGAQTPDMRKAGPDDIGSINAGIDAWVAQGTEGEDKTKRSKRSADIKAAAKIKPHVLLMSKAQGRKIEKVAKENPREFGAILGDQTFQEGLGKILAADALSGNSDRMYAQMGGENKLRAFVHIENLLINKGPGNKYLAVAIDNMFKPEIRRAKGSSQFESPYGFKNDYSAQYSFASLAAAHKQYMTQEAGAIFDRFLAILGRPDYGNLGEQDLDAIRPQKAGFTETVATSALVSMSTLLSRGGWKQTLTQQGASEEEKGQFQERKRYVKLLRAGKTPQEAQTLLGEYDTRKANRDAKLPDRMKRVLQWGKTKGLLSDKEAQRIGNTLVVYSDVSMKDQKKIVHVRAGSQKGSQKFFGASMTQKQQDLDERLEAIRVALVKKFLADTQTMSVPEAVVAADAKSKEVLKAGVTDLYYIFEKNKQAARTYLTQLGVDVGRWGPK